MPGIGRTSKTHSGWDHVEPTLVAGSVEFEDAPPELMEDVSPLPAADVNLSDLSSATLNLMDNAVLTGTATAVSSIGYFGSNV